MLWTFNKNGDEAHEMQFIAWDTAEQIGRRELDISVRSVAKLQRIELTVSPNLFRTLSVSAL